MPTNIVKIVIRALDETKEGFTGSITNLADFEKRVTQVAPALATIGAAAATALAVAGKHFINVADEAGKTAQKVGLTTEEFTRLGYAAGTANVEQEALTSGIKTLSKEITDAVAGNQESIATFRALGVAFSDATGKARNTHDVFIELAERFAKAEDGAGKTAASLKLFGKSGLDLIPILNAGAAGIRDLEREADELGQTISSKTAQDADEFNSNMAKLGAAMRGVIRVAFGEFLPMLVEISQGLLLDARSSGVFEGAAHTLADALKIVGFAAKAIIADLQALYGVLRIIGDFVGNLVSTIIDGFKLVGEGMGTLSAAMLELVMGNFSTAETLWDKFNDDLRNNVEQFKTGVRNAATQVKEDWKSVTDALSKTEAPDLHAFGNINTQATHTTETKQKGNGIVLPPAPKDNTADIISNINRIREVQARLFEDGQSGWAKERSAAYDAFQKILADIDQLKIGSDERLDMQGQAQENYYAKLGELSAKYAQEATEVERQIMNAGQTGKGAQIAAAQEAYEKQAALISKLYISEEESLRISAEAHRNYFQQLYEIEAQYSEQVKALRDQLQIDSMTGYGAEIEAENQRYAAQQKNIAKIAQTEEQALEMTTLAYRGHALRMVQLSGQIAQGVSTIFGNMATAALAFGKKGFAAFKALSIAQTIINTYSSATAAYNAMAGIPYVGPVLAVAAAAAAIAAGIANVAHISSQQAPAAHGGLDYVPAETTYLLQRGERVLSPKQNVELMRFLESVKEVGIVSMPQTSPMLENIRAMDALPPMSYELAAPARSRRQADSNEPAGTPAEPWQDMLGGGQAQPGGEINITVQNVIGGEKIGDAVYKLSRTGQLLIHPSAVRTS